MISTTLFISCKKNNEIIFHEFPNVSNNIKAFEYNVLNSEMNDFKNYIDFKGIYFSNIEEFKNIFLKFYDYNHTFKKRGSNYIITLFYIKDGGEDNPPNMYALKIEQNNETAFVHIFNNSEDQFDFYVEPNSGYNNESELNIYKVNNNTIIIDYNILTINQVNIKNSIMINTIEIMNSKPTTN